MSGSNGLKEKSGIIIIEANNQLLKVKNPLQLCSFHQVYSCLSVPLKNTVHAVSDTLHMKCMAKELSSAVARQVYIQKSSVVIP